MRVSVLALFVVASACFAQEPVAVPQESPAQNSSQPQAPATLSNPIIVVPTGTRIPLALTAPIYSKSVHPGDAVRAQTTFPVTVGKQLAIPANAYVDGVIDKLTKRGASGLPGLQMHFTRLLFANGYTVSLDGATVQVRKDIPSSIPSTTPSTAVASDSSFAAQQPPILTPPPMPGPNMGVFIGIGVGVAAALTVGGIVFSRHHANYLLYDSGYQFDLVLQQPLTLDADKVAAAVAVPNAQ